MRRLLALLSGTALVASLSISSVAAAPPMNHFTGSFDMMSGDTLVAHVVANFQEPTTGGTVPGSVVIRWASDEGVRVSRAVLTNAFFNALDAPFDDPDEGFEYNAFVQGTLCDVTGPNQGSCELFAMVFVETVSPSYPNHVGWSVPDSNVCCDGDWYDVGGGVFKLNYVRETP